VSKLGVGPRTLTCAALAAAAALCVYAGRDELRALVAGDAPAWVWLRASVLRPLRWSIELNFLTPAFAFGMIAIASLERWRPADPQQPFLTRGLLCDAIWVPVREVGRAVFWQALYPLRRIAVAGFRAATRPRLRAPSFR
jgi:hypothetical protein